MKYYMKFTYKQKKNYFKCTYYIDQAKYLAHTFNNKYMVRGFACLIYENIYTIKIYMERQIVLNT